MSFKDKVQDILSDLKNNEKELFYEIIDIEKKKLYSGNPHGINKEIINAVKQRIKK